eukprot:Selendium_serpulae@DN6143_c1_g1_i4.p1
MNVECNILKDHIKARRVKEHTKHRSHKGEQQTTKRQKTKREQTWCAAVASETGSLSSNDNEVHRKEVACRTSDYTKQMQFFDTIFGNGGLIPTASCLGKHGMGVDSCQFQEQGTEVFLMKSSFF